MRAVLQRVSAGSVLVDGETVGRIDRGLVALVGVSTHDTTADADWIADRMVGLRIFENAAGKLDASVLDVGGSVLLVSQFTLHADTRRGRRPSFTSAATGPQAEPLYARVVAAVAARGVAVATGRFGAHMRVALINDGPVTILLDSRET
ncbi:D-tyrosyl-tRNA(Tyr) deacylase [bacterium]|nr:D-tyrosyl-tRNA(Tyr) deacylase [bacterium]